MSKKTRRSFTAEQKAAIVRRHLVDKVPVSNLCDEYGIQPSMFYNWQKVLVDNAARAFETDGRERARPSREAELEQKIAQLEAKLAKKDGIIAEISEEYVTLKKSLGSPEQPLVPHDVRDEVVDFVRDWALKTALAEAKFIRWIGVVRGKFFDWKKRYGKANEHNAAVPRDHWLEPWERTAIISYFQGHPLDGYRRLSFMMLDEDIVAASPATVYRVLRGAGLLDRWNQKPNRKGTGFEQPLRAHEHWHVDIAYLNVAGTFYYLCSVLDGFSRAIVHWEIREAMKEADVETIIQRGRELYPDARPRIISDNGPQFIARDFKEFIRVAGMTHVRTSPYYPQSNGKLERYNRTVKTDFRAKCPASLEEARKVVQRFVEHYNNERLHSAIGFVAPLDVLAGRPPDIWAGRDQKLDAARERRRQQRQIARCSTADPNADVA